MTEIISILARMKSWLLFVLSLTPMLLAMLLFFPPTEAHADLEGFESTFKTMMLISLFGTLIFYAWILTVGIVCNQSLDDSFRKSERLFRFSVPFAMLYITILIWAFPEAILSEDRAVLRMIIIPLHIAATLLLFYSMFFSARSVAMLDQPASPGFWRTLGYFLLILYFPIGLWFIQPRVNSISALSQGGR